MTGLSIDIEKKMTSGKRQFFLRSKFRTTGEAIVLFGPSGAGKTLTIHAIAGLLRPDMGHISLGGRTLFDTKKNIDIPARHRGVGYVFQDYALFPHLDAFQNVAFGLRKKWPMHLTAEDRFWVENLMEKLEILQLSHCLPRDLSGGQRQRVALARALAPKHKLILLDEPFSALDPLLRQKTRRQMAHIGKQFGVSIVMITHDPDDIKIFAETLVIIEEGCVKHIVRNYQKKKTRIHWFDPLSDNNRTKGVPCGKMQSVSSVAGT